MSLDGTAHYSRL